jgi:GT2 family glycosyltransferase
MPGASVLVKVFVVLYQPSTEELDALIRSIADSAVKCAVYLWDNSPAPLAAGVIEALKCDLAARAMGTSLHYTMSDRNLGFGAAHNRLFADNESAPSKYIFLLNQDAELEAGSLERVLHIAEADADDVAAWEWRQIPYEHPKAYNPVTLETPWFSGAAVLIRVDAFRAVAGFENRLFMYGEDVDLSWRLRAAGWRLRYAPNCTVIHRTYAKPAEVKPLQLLGSTYANLCLRARFGTWFDVAIGVAGHLRAMRGRQDFAGRRRGLARNLVRFVRECSYFRATRVRATKQFKPLFNGFGYELRRHGAFYHFSTAEESSTADRPLVSILVRTTQRPAWLREALQSIRHQTYSNIEVVVIEDGEAVSREMIAREFADMQITYRATENRVGRSNAGNLALALARGEWLNFLDDDDVFFADHVEVVLRAARAAKCKGAYAIGWETATRVIDSSRAEYVEVSHHAIHVQPFNRFVLWHHNYLPIQCVLFHRSLYEQYGGFEADMDQLEDWNLWTRYTLNDDFAFVEKTTSIYRIPAERAVQDERQQKLHNAYEAALLKQESMRAVIAPREFARAVNDFVRTQTVVVVTEQDLRERISRSPWVRRATWPLRVLYRRARGQR